VTDDDGSADDADEQHSQRRAREARTRLEPEVEARW
jgi:hypothetical protein